MIKHSTASVFLFDRHSRSSKLALVRHPRFDRWMVPGGHVEPDENPAEAALREALEETGRSARLAVPPLRLPGVDVVVPLPFLIVEERVPADREPAEHIHVDHLYVADAGDPAGPPELPVEWFGVEELAGLEMFDATREVAESLFELFGGTVARCGYQEAADG